MTKDGQKGKGWKRYKEVSVPWSEYDAYRIEECNRILDLRKYFKDLDKPVRGREFPLSNLSVILILKILFAIPYRTLASAVNGLRIYHLLGLKRAPCYKTLQRTMEFLSVEFLKEINSQLIPRNIELGSVDASGLKTTRKGAWVQIRFGEYQQKRDFKKLHIFIDLKQKKIIHCKLTEGNASDHKQLHELINSYDWMRIEIILADKGYDARECFNTINEKGAIPGIPVRKNSIIKARGSPTRKKAVLSQKEDYNKWKRNVQYTMRCVVEAIFSATKRRFGEILFSVKEEFRIVEVWLRTILWNIAIYPR